MNSWSRMFQWSPYGLVLWHAAFLTDFVSKMTKSSLKFYGQGRAWPADYSVKAQNDHPLRIPPARRHHFLGC